MVSSDRLNPLQRDLLEAFFRRERRFWLTGGAALAGFYLRHRESDDLDLFTRPPAQLDDAQRAVEEAARDCGAAATVRTAYAEFRRLEVSRGADKTLVDLVVDRAPEVDPDKVDSGVVRLDSLREIAANKVCTLLSRCEIRDLVDFKALLEAGVDLEQALADARAKDRGADAATLAWLLDELRIGSEAPLPGGGDPAALDAFRAELVVRLRRLAFPVRSD